jgi:flagellin-like hook-associated protein FlgL
MADMTAIPGLDAPPKGDVSLKVNVNATGAETTDARVIDFTGTVPVTDQTFFVKFGSGDDAEMVSYTAAEGDGLEEVLTGLNAAITALSQSKDGTNNRSVTVETIGNSLVITEDTADGGVGDEDIAVTSFIKLATDTDEGPDGDARITLANNKLDIDLRGIEVAAGQSFQLVLGTQTFEYKAAVGDTSEQVAKGLAALIDGATDGFEEALVATSAGSTLVIQMGDDDSVPFAMADDANTAITTGMVFLSTGAVPAADGGANIKTSAAAQAAIANLDLALKFVSEERSTLGAVSNRLTAASDNLSNVSMNISASRSRIEDTDYAQTTTTLAKSQIIQQAATAMLAQANQQPSAVLSLLQ